MARGFLVFHFVQTTHTLSQGIHYVVKNLKILYSYQDIMSTSPQSDLQNMTIETKIQSLELMIVSTFQ